MDLNHVAILVMWETRLRHIKVLSWATKTNVAILVMWETRLRLQVERERLQLAGVVAILVMWETRLRLGNQYPVNWLKSSQSLLCGKLA